ncbi:MAG: 3-phosphoshikimate 1-carboxyvinyltransferase, partial [Anaerolineaceae bacterium]|nr:3-phosphoshikimate 1-carboxyvinyltransferase [Anaerolineaceae bacterium]
ESDRIQTLAEELIKLGVSIQEAEDGFTIKGGKIPAGGTVLGHGDHRLAMAMAVLGLNANAPVCIEGAEIISESFPEFVECLGTAGANMSMMDQEPM